MVYSISIVEAHAARSGPHLLFYGYQHSRKGERQTGEAGETGSWAEVKSDEI